MIKGEVQDKQGVITRVHSSCITGDIFASLKCDCGPQLHTALKRISEEEEGILLYLFQEGRGINIINKISAYSLQEQGRDTVQANEELGFPAEMRQYEVVKEILDDLKVKSICLLTNNPDKVHKLADVGVVIEDMVSLEIEPGQHNEKYLATKKHKMNHQLHVVE